MSYRFATPTLFPAQHFDPLTDAQALRKAMKGAGTDEDAIINIVCRRSLDQRQNIARTYKTSFGKDLIDDIQSETSGKFEKILVVLLTPHLEFHAKELHEAISGIGTDEDVLIEFLCSTSNDGIRAVKHTYKQLYDKDLEEKLASDTSGHFRRLLVSLVNANRDESGETNHSSAVRDAQQLMEAGVNKLGTDESTFNMIFCQRNFPQIKLICEQYHHLAGQSLEEAIRNEFSGNIENGLLAILKCSINRNEYFASRLHKSMAGLGTNDDQLIRLIVRRCEVDLHYIKIAFERLYGKGLRSWIHGDTSGHYKHALYALIGEERSS